MTSCMTKVFSKKSLVENYIHQDYYRDKCVLVLLDIDNTKLPLFDLERILHISVKELGDTSIISVEFDRLETLKESCISLKTVYGSTIEYIAYAYGIEIGTQLYLDQNISEEFLKLNKPPVFVEILRTRSKIPVVGVGGGAMSNMFSCRYVLTDRKELKRAIYVKHSGDICNSKSQALVPLCENDIVIEIRGIKPLDVLNTDIVVVMSRVVVFNETKVECEDISERFDASYIPNKVVVGSHTYHNKNGLFFCFEVKEKVSTTISDEK